MALALAVARVDRLVALGWGAECEQPAGHSRQGTLYPVGAGSKAEGCPLAD